MLDYLVLIHERDSGGSEGGCMREHIKPLSSDRRPRAVAQTSALRGLSTQATLHALVDSPATPSIHDSTFNYHTLGRLLGEIVMGGGGYF